MLTTEGLCSTSSSVRSLPQAMAAASRPDGRSAPRRLSSGTASAELRHVAASSVDVIVTSPPYNIGVDYRSYDDRRPREDYLAWLGEIGLEMKRVLKDEGSLFLNIGGTNRDPWLPLDVAAAFRSLFTCRTISPG